METYIQRFAWTLQDGIDHRSCACTRITGSLLQGKLACVCLFGAAASFFRLLKDYFTVMTSVINVGGQRVGVQVIPHTQAAGGSFGGFCGTSAPAPALAPGQVEKKVRK